MLNWLKSVVTSSRAGGGNPEPERVPVVVTILTQALQAEGCTWHLVDGEIVLPDGLTLSVEYLESQPVKENAVRTSSKVTCRHAVHFPDGIFEFQHASGRSEEESLLTGFRTWVQTDLATLIDAVADATETCLTMEMPGQVDGREAVVKRKIFMGPYIHHTTDPVSEVEQFEAERHDFCPCCLFTKSFDAFEQLLKSHEFVGVRLYAARYENGEVVADCRVNGEDYPLGVEYLKRYAETWPPRGFEFRKQYVAIRTVD